MHNAESCRRLYCPYVTPQHGISFLPPIRPRHTFSTCFMYLMLRTYFAGEVRGDSVQFGRRANRRENLQFLVGLVFPLNDNKTEAAHHDESFIHVNFGQLLCYLSVVSHCGTVCRPCLSTRNHSDSFVFREVPGSESERRRTELPYILPTLDWFQLRNERFVLVV